MSLTHGSRRGAPVGLAAKHPALTSSTEETNVRILRAEYRLRVGAKPFVQNSRVGIPEVHPELHIAGCVEGCSP